MKTLLQYFGAILVLAGVACLAAYYFGEHTNSLLLASMILEVTGIVSYIVVNKFVH